MSTIENTVTAGGIKTEEIRPHQTKVTSILGLSILIGIFLSFVFLVTSTTTFLQNLIIAIGFTCIAIGIWARKPKCPDPIVVYKYSAPTLQEQWDNPQSVSEIYEDLFTKSSPWFGRESI